MKSPWLVPCPVPGSQQGVVSGCMPAAEARPRMWSGTGLNPGYCAGAHIYMESKKKRTI